MIIATDTPGTIEEFCIDERDGRFFSLLNLSRANLFIVYMLAELECPGHVGPA